MDGHGEAQFRAGAQNAQMFVGEPAHRHAERLARAQALGHPLGIRGVHQAARFIGHAEGAVVQAALHVLARFALERRLEIVNGPRAVEGDRMHDPRAHRVHQDRIQAALDRVRSHHQEHRALVAHRLGDRLDDPAKIRRREKVGQMRHELGKTRPGGVRRGEIRDGHLVRPFGNRERPDFAPVKRGVFHGEKRIRQLPPITGGVSMREFGAHS